MNLFLSSVRLVAALTLVTGVAYPAFVTVGAKLMPGRASGSLVLRDGKAVGSLLVRQSFTAPKYFHGRPSVSDFSKPEGLLGTCGSHLAPGDARLREVVEKRRAERLAVEGLPAGTPVPADMLLASASGVDPEISPEAALFQAPRIARVRAMKPDDVRALIDANTTSGGLFGPPCVNVLALNLALDAAK